MIGVDVDAPTVPKSALRLGSPFLHTASTCVTDTSGAAVRR
jgi:hypothetical protein